MESQLTNNEKYEDIMNLIKSPGPDLLICLIVANTDAIL